MITILDTIGNTPLIKLLEISDQLQCEVYAKIESFNPGSSVKDRLAKALIEDGEKKGLLNQSTTIVEPSSGNTGIGLAMVAAMKGYNLIITMPETMSVERRKLMSCFGAKIELTPGSKGMKGAIDQANELIANNQNYVSLGQFDNAANWKAHYKTTGPEIFAKLPKIDYFVAGVGTGGTITGVGSYLKEKLQQVKVVAVEPEDSPVLGGGAPGPHKIQGIGAGFIPKVLNREVIDEIVAVSYEDAKSCTRELALQEGILCGVSSGAAIAAIKELAKKNDLKGKKVVVILPDSGERYLSTDLF